MPPTALPVRLLPSLSSLLSMFSILVVCTVDCGTGGQMLGQVPVANHLCYELVHHHLHHSPWFGCSVSFASADSAFNMQ